MKLRETMDFTKLMTEENGDHLFVHIAAKWLASETDDYDDDDGGDDDPMQIHDDRLLAISIL